MSNMRDVTLSLGIDSRQAAQGARQFEQATNQVQGAATRTQGAVGGLDKALELLLHNIIYVAVKELDPAAMRRIAFECGRSGKTGRAAIEEALGMLSSERWETAIAWIENAKQLDDERLWLATSPVLFL